MGKVFSKEQIDLIRQIRRGYLIGVLCVLIIELVVWVLVIMLSNNVYDPIIGKIQTMFLTFVGCALLNIAAFKNLEIGNNKSRAFAITSFVTAIIATLLDLFLIWEIFPGLDSHSYSSFNRLSVMSKITLSVALTSIATLIEAWIMSIKGSGRGARIFASCLLGFFYLCFLVSIIGVDLTDKLSLLVVVVPLGSLLIYFVATRIAKLDSISSDKIISELAQKEQEENKRKQEELAKKEEERKAKEQTEFKPLQDDSMPSTVNTGGVRLERPEPVDQQRTEGDGVTEVKHEAGTETGIDG